MAIGVHYRFLGAISESCVVVGDQCSWPHPSWWECTAGKITKVLLLSEPHLHHLVFWHPPCELTELSHFTARSYRNTARSLVEKHCHDLHIGETHDVQRFVLRHAWEQQLVFSHRQWIRNPWLTRGLSFLVSADPTLKASAMYVVNIGVKTRPQEWTSRERLSHVFAFYSFSLTFSSIYCIYFCLLVLRGSIYIIVKSYTTFRCFLSTFFCIGGDNKEVRGCWLFLQSSVSPRYIILIISKVSWECAYTGELLF